MTESFRSGYVSLIGRPNVGKSTLLNFLLGRKVAIATEKPQTTRNRIQGIKTYDDAQIIFIDTPGIHEPVNMLGESMVRTARNSMKEIDVVLFVIDPVASIKKDKVILESIKKTGRPVILVINKLDMIKKSELLLIINDYKGLFSFEEIIPVSALQGNGIDILLENIRKYIPFGPKYYPDELFTDQIERFMVAEIIREKIMERTYEEIPYSSAVEILDWNEREDGLILLHANIYVEKEGQKGIIIGRKGKMLKMIGTVARKDIESLLDTKVFLELSVKVRKGWRDNKIFLNELGYL